ncbi:MAG TPA: hypothetical protein VN844_19385 [Pyrinomonadaceae bacterium]|nr:hypothetical protein [Pyrinomonadaceae bacterium]
MDTGYITALAALGGAALSGLTSFASSWTGTQMKGTAVPSVNPSDKNSIAYAIEQLAEVEIDEIRHPTHGPRFLT